MISKGTIKIYRRRCKNNMKSISNFSRLNDTISNINDRLNTHTESANNKFIVIETSRRMPKSYNVLSRKTNSPSDRSKGIHKS